MFNFKKYEEAQWREMHDANMRGLFIGVSIIIASVGLFLLGAGFYSIWPTVEVVADFALPIFFGIGFVIAGYFGLRELVYG